MKPVAPFHTADLCDEFPNHTKVCEPMFISYGKKKKFSGPMITLRVFEDNVMVRKAIGMAPAGSVIVVDGGGSKRCALLGGNLAQIAEEKGISGFVIHGCVRDVEEIEELDIGVRALASNPLKSKKEGKGEENVTVSFGGIAWHPGEYAYVDQDGIVVSPKPLI